MKKQKFDVNSLRTAAPCPIKWESMSGDGKTRFCGLCGLNVYNISEMTRAEARNLIETSEKRVCGRLYRRSDGTVITKDCPVGLRAYYKRAARMAGAALSMILGLFSFGAFGQTEAEKEKFCKAAPQFALQKTENKTGKSFIEGYVKDRFGAVIPNARIIVQNEETKQQISTLTDENGYYSFSDIAEGVYNFRFEAVAFETFEATKVSVGMNEKILFSPQLCLDENATSTIGILLTTEIIEIIPGDSLPADLQIEKP